MIVDAVESGIPVPARWGSLCRYPWATLKVGDSFVWPGTYDAVRSAVQKRRSRHGEQYRYAKVTENGKHLIRVWRVG